MLNSHTANATTVLKCVNLKTMIRRLIKIRLLKIFSRHIDSPNELVDFVNEIYKDI